MSMHKTLFAAALAGLALASAPAAAQAPDNWPSRPVKFIVPVPPGGAADVMARMIAEHLSAKLGQPVVVENRPGAGSTIGMQALAKSAPDGYTIGLGNIAANAIGPAVQPTPYDPIKDFAPVSLVGITPLVLVVNAEKIPAKTVPEFVAYLKANPGKVTFGSSGSGSGGFVQVTIATSRMDRSCPTMRVVVNAPNDATCRNRLVEYCTYTGTPPAPGWSEVLP